MRPWYDEAGALSRTLLERGAWTITERSDAARLAWNMLEWGRVPQRTFDEGMVVAVFREAHDLPSSVPAPMNSGWTKVAALATAWMEGDPHRAPHVIWDSRVSTALTHRLDRLIAQEGKHEPKRLFPDIGQVTGRGGTRPRALQGRWSFAYGRWASQRAGSALVREIRDVLKGPDYPDMPLPSGGRGAWTIRGVESVLFMDGY